jgi:hypothetical protein
MTQAGNNRLDLLVLYNATDELLGDVVSELPGSRATLGYIRIRCLPLFRDEVCPELQQYGIAHIGQQSNNANNRTSFPSNHGMW